MPAVEKRTISLPPAQANYIDALVEAGAYASVSEVVRAGLRALQGHDNAVEALATRRSFASYDAMQAVPARGIPSADVQAALHPVARYVSRAAPLNFAMDLIWFQNMTRAVTIRGPCSATKSRPASKQLQSSLLLSFKKEAFLYSHC